MGLFEGSRLCRLLDTVTDGSYQRFPPLKRSALPHMALRLFGRPNYLSVWLPHLQKHKLVKV